MLEIMLAVGIGALGAYGWYVSDRRLVRRGVARGWWKRVADVPDGQVARLVGEVEAPTLVPAPLSGVACVCYLTEVRGRERGYQRLGRLSGGVRFRLVDSSGAAWVDPSGALCLTGDGRTSTDDVKVSELSPSLRALLERMCDPSGLDGAESLVFSEWYLVPTRLVAVEGRVVREAAAEPGGYRRAAPDEARIEATDERPVTIVAQHGAGLDTGLRRTAGGERL